ncbi:fluoride efflux transporter CrcB [Galenea microaerophila]
MQWLAVALGGALGAMSRFWVSHQVYQIMGRNFAWGTLSVNVLGSFIMGVAAILLIDKFATSNEVRSFIMVGFLGAFTTFSTFSFETMQYIEVGEINKALINIAISVVACLVAVGAGLWVGRQFLVE